MYNPSVYNPGSVGNGTVVRDAVPLRVKHRPPVVPAGPPLGVRVTLTQTSYIGRFADPSPWRRCLATSDADSPSVECGS